MKKLTALLLIAVLAFSLCACGASDEDVRGEKDTVVTAVPVSTEGEATTAATEETTAATEEAYELSLASGNTYTNKYFGFGCTLDDSWTIATEEEMKEQNGLAAEMAGEEFEELINNASLLYELNASKESGEAIGVNIENMGLAGLALNEKSYIDPQKDLLKEALENMGFENVVVEPTPVEFAGGTHAALKVTGEYEGITIEELVITVQHGTRFANISLSTYLGNLDELVACFHAVD